MSEQITIGGRTFQAGALAAPAPAPLAPPTTAQLLEAALAALLAGAFYVALYGELPYHDAARFAAQVNSNRFVFDIAHVYLQPVTLLWHRLIGFGEAAEVSQKHISTAATALAAGVFYALLLRLGIGPGRRIAATVLLVGSCSVITLAPSGHMKLVAFPFVNAALYALMVWERSAQRGAAAIRGIVVGAGLLAVAASLLVSALATAPFASLAVLVASRRGGCSRAAALGRAALFAGVCGGLFAILVCVAFVLFAHQQLTLAGLAASVQGKADLKPAGYGAVATLARLLFGTVNNLVAAPALGSIGRAWIAGQIASLRPYAGVLAAQLLPWCATLALLATIYLRMAADVLRGTGRLMPVAFLCGAQAWTIYYGLNDPEHWFQLTAPTLLLFLALFQRATTRLVMPLWAAGTLAVNLAVIGLPTVRYPLLRYQAELQARFTPNDLLLRFAPYPGGPYLGFFDLPGVPQLLLDQVLDRAGTTGAFFTQLGQAIDATLARGGRVFVVSALDPHDWNAPWADLPAHGLTKARLNNFLIAHYHVAAIGKLAELPTWQLTPRTP